MDGDDKRSKFIAIIKNKKLKLRNPARPIDFFNFAFLFCFIEFMKLGKRDEKTFRNNCYCLYYPCTE